MRITEIRHRTASLKSDIRNAVVDFSEMTTSLVAVHTDVIRDGKPVIGYGFNSNGRYGQAGIISERLIPRIMSAGPEDFCDDTADNLDPFKVWDRMMVNEKPGGHGDRASAVAAIDMAVWDAVAKIAEQPLWRLLSERYNNGASDEAVMVYPGGGYYYPGKDLGKLREEMTWYQDQGYKVVKMKIGGADLATDLKRIEAVLDVVGSGGNLAVDANGRFDLETAITYGEAMTPYGLFWFEEAGDPLDFALQADLAGAYQGAMATGENLFSLPDARNLLRYAGLRPDRDWIQVDPALAYGLTEYLRILTMVEDMGWPRRRMIPHGGHQLALNMAVGLQLGGTESYPMVFQPFGGFADDVALENGYARPHDTPGIGVELKAEMFRELSTLAE
jgi:L-alanine-DL-glutamate epimerase-like enolase superfamily enzyme